MKAISAPLRATILGFARDGVTPNRMFRRATNVFENEKGAWRLNSVGRRIAADQTPFDVDRSNRLTVIRRALPHKIVLAARYGGDTFYDLQRYCSENFGWRACTAIDDRDVTYSFNPSARWEILLFFNNINMMRYGDHCEVHFADPADACFLRLHLGPDGVIEDTR